MASVTSRAVMWMLGSVVSFVAMGAAGRALKGHLDVFEIMLYRSLIGVVVVVCLLGFFRQWGALSTRLLPWHLLRNSVHFVGQGLWFWALMIIPLAQLFAIEFTSPIWVILLAPLFLGETLTRIRLFAAALGFIGILIVAKPDLSSLDPGVLAAAASAVCFAVNVIMTKRLSRGETVLAILFWQVSIQSGLGLITAGWDGAITWPAAAVWPWLAVVAGTALFAHYCLVRALSLAPASVIMPIDFVRLPVAVAMGAYFFNEPAQLSVIFGAALIFLGNWLNIRYGAK